MKKILAPLVTAAIGFLAYVLGTQSVQDEGSKLAVALLNHLTGVVSASQSDREAGAQGYAGPAALTPGVASGAGQLPPDVAAKLRELQGLLVPQLEIQTQRAGQGVMAIERFVQKSGVGGAGEFIELRALEAIDLSGATMGDSKRAPGSTDVLDLPADLRLEAGERVRIFPVAHFGDRPSDIRIVEAGYHKGIWKGDPGERDRVWIKSRTGKLVLDFDYILR